MELKVDRVEVLKIIYDELLPWENYVEDTIAAVTLFNMNYKNDLNVRIYYEKPEGKNPYYVSNTELKKCARLVQRLAFLDLEATDSKQMKTIIDVLYERLVDAKDTSIQDKILKLKSIFIKNELECLFNCITKNNIYILGFRGGYRNKLPHECEVDVQVKLYKDADVNEVIEVLHDLIKEYGAKFKILGGK